MGFQEAFFAFRAIISIFVAEMSGAANNNRKGDSGRSEKAVAWQTAIGLQAADGLSASEFIYQLSQKHVNGKISIDQAAEQLNHYYFEKNSHDAADPEKEEADKVSLNIARILLSDTLDFSADGLASLHRKIFEGIYENAGVLRTVDVSKREWVLGGDTVSFMSLESLPGALDRCIAKEKNYRYDTQSPDTLISHLSAFISELWQICAFGDGNTRFTAVVAILYLNYLGIKIENSAFSNYSWYFHNAIVRANYRDIVKNIDYEPVFLERFFRNLLLGEQWDLRNRYVHVRPAAEWSEQPNLNSNTSTGQVRLKNNTRKVRESGKKAISKSEDSSNTYDSLSDAKANESGITENIVEKPKIAPEQDNRAANCLDNPNILFLAVVIGDRFLSVKEIMDGLHLKGRDSFLKLYLVPAVNFGIVSLLYPQSPRHPRQKYLLTDKGFEFLRAAGPEMTARVERHLASLKA